MTAKNTNIEEFIKYAKSNGIELKPCDYFNGEQTSWNGEKYFNVLTGERIYMSKKFDQLERLSRQYKSFRVEPNGVDRLAIFTA